ncbi:MAG TPA: phosphoribosyltransferase family protein, partial [Armatimonadota bacterium]|nr:phosphoribosyltransferase family protein [Armatimonadota bacterium]
MTELLSRTGAFQDRADAGRQLAHRLQRYRDEHPIVLGLPRGGVAVAYEVASALDAPLDVFIARKLGAPNHPEFAVGAIAPGGVVLVDRRAIQALHISREQLEEVARAEGAEVERRLRQYRDDRPPPQVRGRTVILVDDGLATGMTARAAVQSLRQQGPRRVVLAVPVGAAETVEALSEEVDDLVCLLIPP